MNKTGIEWCDYSWNPITGCLHKCSRTYCYNTTKFSSPLNRFGAKYKLPSGEFACEKDWRKRQSGGIHIADKGEIYPYGYDPTFYPHRLHEPVKVKTPARVFTVDTGDMFGRWIPEEWIEQILKQAGQCTWHTFLLLTKNPARLSEFHYPDNAWVGASINSDADIDNTKHLRKAKAKALFLSIEPLLGYVSYSAVEGVDWIILGAQTGRNPVKPHREWIESILSHARRLGVPVFMKNNIAVYSKDLIQQFPTFS
jgi:protein gp37